MRLVRVWWRDAASIDAWTDIDELDTTPPVCSSIGYLVKETDEAVSVAGTLGDGEVCNVMTIPRGMVDRIEDLRSV